MGLDPGRSNGFAATPNVEFLNALQVRHRLGADCTTGRFEAADATQMRADDAAHFATLQGDLTSWHDDERLRRRLVGAHELECKCSKDNCLTSARLGLRDHVDAHAAYWDRTCLDGRWPPLYRLPS